MMLERGGLLPAAAVAVVMGATAIAQRTTATSVLDGVVVDQRCAVVTGASVTVRQLAGALTRTASTDRQGKFRIDHLPAGEYAVTASESGFVAATRPAVDLEIGATVSSSLVLEPDSPQTPAEVRTACVPVEMSRGVMTVRGRINQDPTPVWLLLDTGASVSVVAEALANARGIPIRTTGEMRAGIGEGSSRIGMIGRMTINVAGATVNTSNTVALPLGEGFEVIGHQADGILGSDVFLQYVVRIDYAAASVTFLDAQSFTYQGTGIPIPITLSGNTPDMPVTLEAGGNVLTARAELDTGSDGTIGLTRPFVDKNHLLDGRTTIPGFALGVGGEATVLVGRIDSLRLGPFAFPQPVLAFSRAMQGTTAANARDGIMGAEVLRRFTVIVDYPHRRAILEPNARLGDPFEFDKSGLVLAKNSRGTVRVLSIRAGTPASESTIHIGDEIASIDGHAASALPLDTISRWFRQADRDYRLTLVRAGQPFEIVLRTRRLI